MKSKKAQEGIIVTVLLVLVAIAAVSAVAYFVINNIRSGTAAATDKTDCLKVSLSLDNAKATYTTATSNYTDLTLSRQNDAIVLKAVNIYVNGKLFGSTSTIPAQLETATATLVNTTKVLTGDKVRINPVLNSTGYICEVGSEKLAVA